MGIAVDEIIENVEITEKRRSGAFNMPVSHYHDHYEIYYLKKGRVRYFVGERIYDLDEGDVILIPPHAIHRTASLKNEGAERLLIAFTNEFVMYSPGDRIFSGFEVCYYKKPPVKEIIEKAASEFFNKDRYSDELIAGYIRETLVHLKRISDVNYIEEKSDNDSIIQNAVHYICDNYSTDLTLTELAREFALSESHFSRQFKAYTGFGVNEYIATVRVKNAEKMLITTNSPITEIAQNCGFNSSSYFAAVFKKVRGTTPISVRKKRGNKN